MMIEVSQSLAYSGPNRRSDQPVIEKRLDFDTVMLAGFDEGTIHDHCIQHLGKALPELTERLRLTGSIESDAQSGPADQLGLFFARLGVALQQWAGHPVAGFGLVENDRADQTQVFFEFEEPDTGLDAADVALEILRWLCLAGPDDQLVNLVQQLEQFLTLAAPRAMPADSSALFKAALRRDIPVMRMDRPPYAPITGAFRVRPHGLFRLGHGHRQQTLDGTFCVSRNESLSALVHDRERLFERLENLGFKLAGVKTGRWVQSSSKAARIARQLGFPVVLRAGRRGSGGQFGQPLQDQDALEQAFHQAIDISSRLLVQPVVRGREFMLLAAGGGTERAVLEYHPESRRWQPISQVDPGFDEAFQRLLEAFPVAMLAATLIMPDPNQASTQSAGALIDVDLAPRLDRILAGESDHLKRLTEAMMDWIFPWPAKARVPIIAITGTNGKTTTTQMVARIMRQAGHATGMACSNGSWLNDQQLSQLEDGYLPGHMTILDNGQVELAVLEATRGAAGSSGLGFDRCHTAVCLNVTADHFGDLVGLESVADLAALKQTIIDRADRAIVLNADDPHCRSMVRSAGRRRVGLVSLVASVEELRQAGDEAAVYGVIERVANEKHLVIHDGATRLPVASVKDIPLTFGGAARFNLSNALHAAVASYMTGAGPEQIAQGLKALATGFESTPGRLSFDSSRGFDVCMDYAHNPAGIKSLGEFVGQLDIAGRRILCMSCSNASSDDLIRATGRAAAGFFDFYICKNFGLLYDRQAHEGPQLLREGLLSGGVPDQCIERVEDEFDAIDAALAMGQPGDLVMIIGGKRQRQIWSRIIGKHQAATAGDSTGS